MACAAGQPDTASPGKKHAYVPAGRRRREARQQEASNPPREWRKRRKPLY
ncbi:hypothetical protein JCM14635_25770 [Megalodesulfovibrio paquesii]